MSVVNLYDGIYRVLANDPKVLNYLGIDESGDAEEVALRKAERIQKRSKPQKLTEILPVITFYAPPGRRESGNLQVYNTNFVFDLYTQDDVNTAQRMASRIQELFDGVIHPFMGVENFESLLVTMHESESDLQNTYCFTVVISFSITLED